MGGFEKPCLIFYLAVAYVSSNNVYTHMAIAYLSPIQCKKCPCSFQLPDKKTISHTKPQVSEDSEETKDGIRH